MNVVQPELHRRFRGEAILRRRLRIAASLLARVPVEERSAVAWAWVDEGGAVRWQTSLPEYFIGRGQGCAPRLKGLSISRQHAHVKRREDGFYVITDLASKNGVRVNERVISKTTLFAGDLVEIGGMGLIFFGESESDVAGLSPPTRF